MENTHRADYLLPRHAGHIVATALLALSLSGCGPGDPNRNCGDVAPYVGVNGDFVPSSSFSQTGCALEGTVNSDRDGNFDNNCHGSASDEGKITDLLVEFNMEPGDLVTVTAHDAQVQAACYPTSFGIGEFLQTQGNR